VLQYRISGRHASPKHLGERQHKLTSGFHVPNVFVCRSCSHPTKFKAINALIGDVLKG